MNDIFERMERLRSQERRSRSLPIEQALGGGPHLSERGSFYRRSQALGGALCHGPFPLASAGGPAVSALLAGIPAERPLFLDTETTGLAGGSGTYAFLIGLAYFQGQDLCLEQLIMRSHAEEKAMLAYLIERVQECDALVTFNGKSFDIPLLQTRLIMNRLRYDLEELPHLDLLGPSRRLWSMALENCKLETLEREILGLPREHDIPGWMVPQVFFRYLEDGCARGLARVAEHNRRDILAMVGLVGGMSGYWSDPYCPQRRFRQHPPLLHLEDLALGQALYRQRRFTESARLLERAWDYWRVSGGPAWRRTGALLARLQRRLGHPEQAQQIWRELAGGFPRDVEVLEQLAKQHEHLHRDWPGALSWVERALSLDSLSRGRRERLIQRRRRLQNKLESA